MAQWKRAGPITQRSVDRNHALLNVFAFHSTDFRIQSLDYSVSSTASIVYFYIYLFVDRYVPILAKIAGLG